MGTHRTDRSVDDALRTVPPGHAPGGTDASRSRRAALLVAVLLACLAFGVYARNLDDYFLADDFDLIVSFHGKPASYFLALLYSNESGDAWSSLASPGSGYLRPIKIWLMKLDLALWGTHAFGFHLTATLIFALNVVVIFLILTTLLRDLLFAFVGASMAALHPVFSEIVPVITFREETLTTFFGLTAFLAFVRHRESSRSMAAFYVFCVLALLTKESGIGVFALCVGYDAVRVIAAAGNRREELRQRLPFYAPALLLIPAYFALRWFAFGDPIGDPHGHSHELLSIAAFGQFHAKFFWFLFTEPMFAFHGVPFVRSIAVAVLVGGSSIIAWGWYRGRLDREHLVTLVFLGPAWYLASTAALHGIYFDPRHNVLPVIGILMFVATLACLVVRVLGARWRLPTAAFLIAAAALAFWGPTSALSREYEEASEIVEGFRAKIELETAHLGPGSLVMLRNVPQAVTPPYYFGWGLRSSLMRPFTSTDLARHSRVVDARNLELNAQRSPIEKPERIDVMIRFRGVWPPSRPPWPE